MCINHELYVFKVLFNLIRYYYSMCDCSIGNKVVLGVKEIGRIKNSGNHLPSGCHHFCRLFMPSSFPLVEFMFVRGWHSTIIPTKKQKYSYSNDSLNY